MDKIRRNCPDCGTSLEKTPLDKYYYCDCCNKSVSIDHPVLQAEEAFIKFNNMHSKCRELRKQLESEHDVIISAEGHAYEIIGWPKSGDNKFYKRHCSDEFGKDFKKVDNKPLTEEDRALIEKYLLQVNKTKLFGDILISYAELRDSFVQHGLEFDDKIFGTFVENMRKIYETTDCPKEIENKKPRKSILLKKEETR